MDKENILSVLNMMFDLSTHEKEELKKLPIDELEKRYKLYLLEKSEEML